MDTMRWRAFTTVVAAILLGAGVVGQQQNLRGFKDPSRDLQVVREGFFFVNGQYYTSAADGLRYMANQMYVEYQVPKTVTHPYPIVMIHGAAQTGTNFMATPDGRPGWAQFFVANGYVVYIADQVGRGRSNYSLEKYGAYGPPLDVVSRQQNWSVQQLHNLFPRASLHTQWPGTGREGDPFFDQFYASQVQFNRDAAWTQTAAQAAGTALLDRIGPAILLTHSQSGTFGFLIADKRPRLVKGVITVEGGGTPHSYVPVGPPDWFRDGGVAAPWGMTSIPLTYEPLVTDASELSFVQEENPTGPDVRCWLQAPPARQLPNLKGIPQLLVVGEASAASSTNQCVSHYLTQAGVKNTWVDLGKVGIHGNGHMMMFEKNHLEIAAFLASWLRENVEKGSNKIATN